MDIDIMKKKVLLFLLVALVLAQFIKPDRSVPEYNPAQSFEALNLIDDNTMQLVKGACYDCHSHETIYPGYANIAPVSWWLQGHINGGKQKLNFSTWSDYDAGRQQHKIDEIIEVMEQQRMPLSSYALMHKAGRINKEKADQIVEAFRKL